ncbi:peptidoglycan-binding protein [Hankyongella ginsenosidimutans]|uniref:Peptidoglycan-binding protein n=1 Tax=Hankyongella ginsenosidimutans TaxID=1763828 RepID=A0A4D7C861_9SPHN|nr:peptidoglycan-binding protein [Hankyongella ginsenosidimutans]QCI78903.1 peptidoglycan-binding protein [Hankyongella ginsenosidimutans]
MFAGWMEGMLSGINVYQADTFDMVPWQSTDLLALAAAEACKRDPKASFHTAVLSVSRSLYNGRLRERSDRVVLGKAPQQVALYAAVIAQAQARLVALKLLKEKPTGKMSSATTAALKAFQKSKSCRKPGCPTRSPCTGCWSTDDPASSDRRSCPLRRAARRTAKEKRPLERLLIRCNAQRIAS